jgi:hypothetical protein
LTNVDASGGDGVKAQMFRFFNKFFKVMNSENYLLSVNSPVHQINYINRSDQVREENMSYSKILANADRVGVSERNYFSSMYVYPSVSSDFLNFILKLTTPNYALNSSHPDRKINLSPLFTSNYLASIRHIDIITTYVSVVFSLLKQTTHYSSELNVDTTVFSVDNPEPFGLEYSVDL